MMTNLPQPDGPPQSASEVGWDYHLVVKGFQCSNRPGAVGFLVEEFLFTLFDGLSSIPVKYGYHSLLASDGQGSQVLRVSFSVNDGLHITLDAALQTFCQRMFSTAASSASDRLSKFGIYGFSPEQETMKYYWYEAMFSWMHSNNEMALSNIESHLARLQRGGQLISWIPNWTGAIVFAASLGLTWAFTKPPKKGKPLHISTAGVQLVNSILLGLASEREKEGHDAVKLAEDSCGKFIRCIETVTKTLSEEPTLEKPQMKLHRDAANHLVSMFEEGYRTVTVCTSAAELFLEARNAYSLATILSAINTGILTTNALMLAKSASSLAVSRVSVGFSWVQAGVGLGQAIYSGVKTYQTEQQRAKWAKVGMYVAASMKIGQNCECYLHWTYNSGGQNPLQMSNVLRDLMESMEATLPQPEDCTPEAVRAQLLQNAETLNTQRIALVGWLSNN